MKLRVLACKSPFAESERVCPCANIAIFNTSGGWTQATRSHRKNRLWPLVTAALSLCLGVLLLYKPGAGAVSLTLALTAFFAAEGVFQIVTSLAYRKALPDAWGWLLASGVCDLILVAIIVASWPLSAAWTLGTIWTWCRPSPAPRARRR